MKKCQRGLDNLETVSRIWYYADVGSASMNPKLVSVCIHNVHV